MPTRDELRNDWFGSTGPDEDKLEDLFDKLGLPERPIWDVENRLRVRLVEVMRNALDGQDDHYGDLIDKAAEHCVEVPVDMDGSDNAYAEWHQRMLLAARRQLAGELLPDGVFVIVTVTGTVADDEQSVEIFTERPRTPLVDPTNSWENWPVYYSLYQGNPNGGDSVLLEFDRKFTDFGRSEFETRGATP